MILILRKESPQNQNFLLSLGESVYITPDYAELHECIRGASTLRDLGFSVKTGEVVWNQEKDKLTNEPDGAERIIYTSNIGEDGALTFDLLKGEKKQYIRGFHKETVCGPAIVVSRGYGNNYSFQWALVPAGTRFYGENHVNVVTGPPEHIDRVVASFRSERARTFIQMFVGNGALSKTELETIFPIF
jgi:adenine-specific DNA-methyltransferase